MLTPEERRSAPRISDKKYITVTVESAPGAPALEGFVLRCTTRDLSESGLNMIVHSPVPEGTQIGIRVVFSDPPAEFHHLARVMWSKTIQEGFVEAYSIGIAFRRTENGGGREWRDRMRAPMSDADSPGTD